MTLNRSAAGAVEVRGAGKALAAGVVIVWVSIAISSMRDGSVYGGFLFPDISVDILGMSPYGVLRR
jgi:hypothetical protein